MTPRSAASFPSPAEPRPLSADARRAFWSGAHRAVLSWYRRHGRRLPWRDAGDPYRVLVSEFMLQQTRVQRVLEAFEHWMHRFPTLDALSRANARDVLLAWAGLGYNRRALYLLETARLIADRHAGRIPDEPAVLETLPGIGSYAAGAIACFGNRARVPVVDVNVQRVLSRVARRRRAEADVLPLRDARELAGRVLPPRAFHDWNQALMDLGALVCTSRSPRCGACPLKNICRSCGRIRPRTRTALAPGPVPRRIWRGRVLDVLVRADGRHSATASAIGSALRADFGSQHESWLRDVLASLHRDGLVSLRPPRRFAGLPPDRVPLSVLIVSLAT